MAYSGKTSRNNFYATAAPTVNDDRTAGYSGLSLWCDLTNDNAYVCLDDTDGAAVWALIGGTGALAPGTVGGQIDIGDGASDGASANYARSDHQHAFPAPSAGYPLDVSGTENDGVATTAARSDHVHRGVHSVSKSGDTDLYGDIELAEGSNVTLTQAGQTITIASSGGSSPGSVGGQIDIGDAASDGVSANYARADHQHAFPAPGAGYPTEIAATEADGTASTPARSDHVHRGVHSIGKSAGTDLYGDVELAEGSNVTITQSGQTLTIASTAGGGSAADSAPLAVADTAATGADTTHYALDDHVHKMGVITTKGDILTWSTLPIRLAVGTNNYILTADSSQSTGLKWAGIWNTVHYDATAVPSVGGDALTDREELIIDTAAQTYVLNLPSAAIGARVRVRRYGNAGGSASITVAAGDALNDLGGSPYAIPNNVGVELVAGDNTTWFVMLHYA